MRLQEGVCFLARDPDCSTTRDILRHEPWLAIAGSLSVELTSEVS